MTPRTRTSNKDASYKVYYSKKVPQQVRFPHRRKAVRRPEPVAQDAGQKRQMKFLPEMMRQPRTKEEESETEEESTAQATAIGGTVERTPKTSKTGIKRKDGDLEGELVLHGSSVSTSSKRRRRTTAPKEEPTRTFRRQSTMTQLADGQRPSAFDDEPDFKPVKRSSRASWGGPCDTEWERAKKQRTLTQMIPGIGRLTKEELEELSDLDADPEDDETSDNAVSQTLLEQGLLYIDVPMHMAAPAQHVSNVENHRTQSSKDGNHDLPAALHPQSSVVIHSSDTEDEDPSEQAYQPTQFIEAPARRTGRTPRRMAAPQFANIVDDPARSTKPKFSLLSTPEKRRVFEIPSSQSPAESILSTQTSPQKSNTFMLRERPIDTIIIAETPSKCRQVTFQDLTVQPAPPIRLRKFKSTIQDSEDEEESDVENDGIEEHHTDTTNRRVHALSFSSGTQAAVSRADLACADGNGDMCLNSQESSQEVDDPTFRQRPYQPSPELGESWAPVIYEDDGPGFESYQSLRSGIRSQPFRGAAASEQSLPILDQTVEVSQLDLTESTQARMPVDDLPSTPPIIQRPHEDIPSTPMVIEDESSDHEGARPEPDLPRTLPHEKPEPPSTLVHQSTDLDGEPVQIQRSPSADHETQQSHSSKAEQQLHNEWLSYSQYAHGNAPKSSSMHTAVDTFSRNATPRCSRTEALVPSSARVQHSQATTVDEVTPKKARAQRITSANTTPRRPSKSQPFVSPERPPSLFIPSSFPSPSRTAMEGWSSPMAVRTQNVPGSSQMLGSLEDFSIPPPPPREDE
ncbi:hypothetical protein OPT61_g3339 [Boeremia exigua]|uniref:Uncharacterized protein n=1 Tax=Boeremia exigua TaxID=749465 RepID=A0ACC2II91_9PLEO|nr:hypothetical protein OPT61_g3339 [Boeremia exigua]